MSDELPPDFDIYAFLDLAPEASSSQIRRAYRTKSLLYHPDKNPSPSAVTKFHYLNLSIEILSSPTARTAYDNVRKARAAKAERTAKYDTERRRMQRDLETREREAKRRRMDGGQETRVSVEEEESKLREAVEKLKEESERLKRERDRRLQEDLMKRPNEAEDWEEDESLRTVKVRFHKGVDRSKLSTERIEEMFSKYGDVENVILGKSALVIFETVAGAKAAAGFKKGESEFIKEVTMAESTPLDGKNAAQVNPPRAEANLEKTSDKVEEQQPPLVFKPTSVPSTAQGPPKPRFSFKPPSATNTADAADYESITLLRMRKLEREKLEREIRETEEKEAVQT